MRSCARSVTPNTSRRCRTLLYPPPIRLPVAQAGTGGTGRSGCPDDLGLRTHATALGHRSGRRRTRASGWLLGARNPLWRLASRRRGRLPADHFPTPRSAATTTSTSTELVTSTSNRNSFAKDTDRSVHQLPERYATRALPCSAGSRWLRRLTRRRPWRRPPDQHAVGARGGRAGRLAGGFCGRTSPSRSPRRRPA